MAVNTAYLNTAGSPAGFSNQSQIAGSQVSFVNVEVTSGLTVGGAVQFNSTISLVGAISAGAITAAGAIIGNSTLSMVGASSLGNLTVASGATFNSTISAVGATSLGAVTASSLTVSGILASTGTADLDASVLLSKQTTASFTSLTLKDGEFAVGAVSVTSAVLYFRSGATTYRWIADAGAII